MSTEGDVVQVAASEVAPNAAMSFEDALRVVLKNSHIHNGLSRGLRECVKSLDRRDAQLCILSKSCDEPEYVKLIKALCTTHNIRLIEVADSKELGEWVGLCKIDKNGDAQKVVGCGCAVIRSFGIESEAKNVLMSQF